MRRTGWIDEKVLISRIEIKLHHQPRRLPARGNCGLRPLARDIVIYSKQVRRKKNPVAGTGHGVTSTDVQNRKAGRMPPLICWKRKPI